MLRTASQAEHQPRQAPTGGRVEAQIEVMRRRGMSPTAIRRALGLGAREASAAGILGLELAASPPDAQRPRRPGPRCGQDRQGLGRGPAMLSVLNAVARAAGVPAGRILGAGQTRALVRPRHLTMHLVRRLCAGASLPAIGHFLARDHTTVLHGCRRAEALLARDAGFLDLRDRALKILAAAQHDQSPT